MQEYIDIGLERIQKFTEDSLKTRPIYQKIYEPSGSDSVSKYPVEWLEKRLHEIEEILIEDDADENMQRDGSIVECYRKDSYKIL